ncbi:hypothetical protein VTL71DRAFT_8458 [Oculimacula yallundae]|uniref:Uncharacterized protein n=1 Tax=Oculimacula yallundae TaxID=86028 RepID=A0ABR4CXP7_9HELO
MRMKWFTALFLAGSVFVDAQDTNVIGYKTRGCRQPTHISVNRANAHNKCMSLENVGPEQIITSVSSIEVSTNNKPCYFTFFSGPGCTGDVTWGVDTVKDASKGCIPIWQAKSVNGWCSTLAPRTFTELVTGVTYAAANGAGTMTVKSVNRRRSGERSMQLAVLETVARSLAKQFWDKGNPSITRTTINFVTYVLTVDASAYMKRALTQGQLETLISRLMVFAINGDTSEASTELKSNTSPLEEEDEDMNGDIDA